jgi:TolB-like protein/Tfp pilus assembly protein PilF
MASERSSDVKLEIGHVLFIDIVGYSKLLITEQSEQIQTLKEIVRGTEQVRVAEAEGKLLRLPTGDGGALVFRNNPEAPILCALEISKALKNHPELRVRMGAHSGPVNEVTDLNEQANIAGAGVNMAQRVMDCGDAGHILLSKRMADDLEQYPKWRPCLHDLGECEVKHGMRIGLVNVYDEEIGNPRLPEKLEVLRKYRARLRRTAIATAVLLLAAIVAAFVFASKKSAKLTEAVPEKSIAVLPFENLSEDKSNAYFADGIQEEILTRLANISDLKVISRTSTASYRSKPESVSEIAKRLGVATILEGSVQKTVDQVRVNVQLIHATSDSHLWAQTYDRRQTDIFAVESEIASAIAEALQAKLTGREKQAITVKPTNNPEAYDLYLRGLAFERAPYTLRRLSQAVGFFERATQLDPTFAVAFSRLSRAHAFIYFGDLDATPARRDAAAEALRKARIIQPNGPETLIAQAFYEYHVLRDYERANSSFETVEKAWPGSSEVAAGLALIARRQGRWEQSLRYWDRTLVLDPQNLKWLSAYGLTFCMCRRFPEALKTCDRALDIVPNHIDFIAAKAGILAAQGDLDQARKLLAGVDATTSGSGVFEIKVSHLRIERRYDEAIQLLRDRFNKYPEASEEEKASYHLVLAFNQRLAGDVTGATDNALQAKAFADRICKQEPDSPFSAVFRSQACAVLGEKEQALLEAERAVKLLPPAKDALEGPVCEENAAFVEALLGVKGPAISKLEHLLQIPYDGGVYNTPLTTALLRCDPLWDSLRGDPRFEKLVAKP